MILELRNLLPDVSLLRRDATERFLTRRANDVAGHGWKSLRVPRAIYISGLVLSTCIKARPRIVYGSVDRTSQMRVTHGADFPRGIFLPRDSTYFVIYSRFLKWINSAQELYSLARNPVTLSFRARLRRLHAIQGSVVSICKLLLTFSV